VLDLETSETTSTMPDAMAALTALLETMDHSNGETSVACAHNYAHIITKCASRIAQLLEWRESLWIANLAKRQELEILQEQENEYFHFEDPFREFIDILEAREDSLSLDEEPAENKGSQNEEESEKENAKETNDPVDGIKSPSTPTVASLSRSWKELAFEDKREIESVMTSRVLTSHPTVSESSTFERSLRICMDRATSPLNGALFRKQKGCQASLPAEDDETPSQEMLQFEHVEQHAPTMSQEKEIQTDELELPSLHPSDKDGGVVETKADFELSELLVGEENQEEPVGESADACIPGTVAATGSDAIVAIPADHPAVSNNPNTDSDHENLATTEKRQSTVEQEAVPTAPLELPVSRPPKVIRHVKTQTPPPVDSNLILAQEGVHNKMKQELFQIKRENTTLQMLLRSSRDTKEKSFTKHRYK
jgi:hypothetical protein